MRENLTYGSMRGSRGGPLGWPGGTVTRSTRKGEKKLVITCGGWEQAEPVPYSTQRRGGARLERTFKAQEVVMVKQFKIIVEKHPDGYVAYPLGLKGVVVGEGDTYEEALADAKSAIQFHIETFGQEVIEVEPPILEAFVAEAGVAV